MCDESSKMIAKRIANDFWIIVHGGRKVGHVKSLNKRFNVVIDGSVTSYDDLPTFLKVEEMAQPTIPTTFNTKHKFTVFGKTRNGKCLHAVGWYAYFHGGRWTVEENPKTTKLDKYEWIGPFESKELAQNAKHKKIC